jgi:predicted peptidase
MFEERQVLDWRYRVFVPGSAANHMPAILFLHGRGESGNDNERQLKHFGRAIEERPEEWPFLVIFPQKLDPQMLWPPYAPMLREVLIDVQREFEVDSNRCYLTGLSQGGHGAFTLSRSLPWRFSAVAPMCGWADSAVAAWELRDTPVWAFHGEADDVVLPSSSVAVIDYLKRDGCDAKLTLMPEVGHNCWDSAYRDYGLAEWFLQHTLARS